MSRYFTDNTLPVQDDKAFHAGTALGHSYMSLVAENRIAFDPCQWQVLQHLQHLLEALGEDQPNAKRWTLRPAKAAAKPPGLYIFGTVGCGKSLLMDLFYAACPVVCKRRVHCAAFMLEAHQHTHQFRHQGEKDALGLLAEKIRASCRVLCLDEFQVTDIADALFLERLLARLFALGVVVVITSNRHPQALYQSGLQQKRLQCLADLLSGHATIIELDTKNDYRAALDRQQDAYYYPLDEQEPGFIAKKFQEFSGGRGMQPQVLEVYRHPLKLSATAGAVVLVQFAELCAKPLGSVDYIALAQRFTCVILQGIPKLTADQRNEAKRFVTLIDVLYEHQTRLICSAETAPHLLYESGDGAFEFRRAASRLLEMQSHSYWWRLDAAACPKTEPSRSGNGFIVARPFGIK